LMYHRVAEARADPWSLSVAPSVFAAQMEAIRAVATPIALRELVRRTRERTLPRRAVAVTFDDGYEDNAAVAAPVLERLDIPATIFVTADAVGRSQPFWWDELPAILLERPTLPQTLRVHTRANTHEWELGSAAEMNHLLLERYSTWKAFEPPPTQRHRILQDLASLLPTLEPCERGEVVEQLRDWSGSDMEAVSGRPLSMAQVARLASSSSIEVGAHSRTHGRLRGFPLPLQAQEVTGSKTALEEMTGRPVLAFAYPFGATTDFTSETVALVRQVGFEVACTSDPGAVRPASSAFRLPRMHPTNWRGEELAARVLWWARSQS